MRSPFFDGSKHCFQIILPNDTDVKQFHDNDMILAQESLGRYPGATLDEKGIVWIRNDHKCIPDCSQDCKQSLSILSTSHIPSLTSLLCRALRTHPGGVDHLKQLGLMYAEQFGGLSHDELSTFKTSIRSHLVVCDMLHSFRSASYQSVRTMRSMYMIVFGLIAGHCRCTFELSMSDVGHCHSLKKLKTAL
jgi:hypothetical protein